MLAVIVILVIAFMAYVGGSNGSWGAVAVTAVIGIVVLIGVYGVRSDDRAVQNWLNSWKKGGRNDQRTSNRRSGMKSVSLKNGQSLDDFINQNKRHQRRR